MSRGTASTNKAKVLDMHIANLCGLGNKPDITSFSQLDAAGCTYPINGGNNRLTCVVDILKRYLNVYLGQVFNFFCYGLSLYARSCQSLFRDFFYICSGTRKFQLQPVERRTHL